MIIQCFRSEIMLQAYEFSSVIEDRGIIKIPEQYLENITSPVKIIILTRGKAPVRGKKHFSAMKIKTHGFRFDRNEANER